MNRYKIKLILLISGLIFFAASTSLFILNIDPMNPLFLLALAGLVPLIVVSLMHSKDIRETRRGLSSFLKALAYFWIITGSLNAAALIVINLFLIR